MMHAYGATHRGRRRENNEDAFHIEEPLRVAILADGMGGESCGEVGSAITVRAVTEYLGAPEAGLTREEVLKEAIRSANRQVIEAAKLRTECEGMGSTIVMVSCSTGPCRPSEQRSRRSPASSRSLCVRTSTCSNGPTAMVSTCRLGMLRTRSSLKPSLVRNSLAKF